MRVERLATIGVWIVIASATALGQHRDDGGGPRPSAPAESVVSRTYPLGGVLPSRRVETRNESGGGEVVTETIVTPDVDGKPRPTRETITETIRTGSSGVQTRRDVFEFGSPGQRRLLETARSERETLPDGTLETIQESLAPDLNGRLELRSREVQRITSSSNDVKQTDIDVFQPGVNVPLQESERIRQTERQVNPDLRRSDTTRFVRDANGRFQPMEMLSLEVRTTGPSENVAEETIRRLDVNGQLTVSEKLVTRRFEANGQTQTVVETFSTNVSGLVRADRLELTQRVRRTTTSTPDGADQIVEEVEARAPGSPSEPIRMVRRTVGTSRKVGPERWVTERNVYVLDVNGRFVLDLKETGEGTVK